MEKIAGGSVENNKAHVTGVEQVFAAERDGKEMDVMVKLDILGSMHVFYPVIISCIDCLVKIVYFSKTVFRVFKIFSFFSHLVPSDPEWPTDAPPNTVAPTSQAPTTIAPTTIAPTTLAPTTEAPEEETTKSDSPSGGLLKIFLILPSLK